MCTHIIYDPQVDCSDSLLQIVIGRHCDEDDRGRQLK